jgi:hypothetical protein
VLHKINLEQIDYQNIIVSSSNDLILTEEYISQILLGIKFDNMFIGIDSTHAKYESTDSGQKMVFQFNHEFSDSILIANISLRYLFNDNSLYDLDTFKIVYKFPYESTEIFMNWDELIEPPAFDIQSFDIVNSRFYYHPYGAFGLYEYDMFNTSTMMLIGYSGGDYIASSDEYVFCDINHNMICRYIISTDTTDIKINISSYLNELIKGLEVNNDELYVLTDNESILRFSLDLQYKGIYTYSNSTYGLTIQDNIAYSNDNTQILRFNLSTLNFIGPVALPTSNCEAIRIVGEKLYFTDYKKQVVAYVNLSEF